MSNGYNNCCQEPQRFRLVGNWANGVVCIVPFGKQSQFNPPGIEPVERESKLMGAGTLAVVVCFFLM